MGLYLGKVQNYQKNKGYVTLKLREKLGVGDTISINGEKARIYCFRINGW